MSDDLFYSALLHAVERADGVPKSGTTLQWCGWLDGAQRRGELKRAERDWLGVDAWLDGRGTTSRQELSDFLRTNQVQVNEVLLVGDGTPSEADIEALLGDETGEGMSREDAVEYLTDPNGDGVTRYARYQLPGGANYRELLLTLPSRESTPAPLPIIEGADGRFRVRASTSVGRGTMFDYPAGGHATRADAEAHAERLRTKRADTAATFRTNHFVQPNILAHLRFNERTDAESKRVLFIEELQSDWHQAGRKKGYKAPLARKDRDQFLQLLGKIDDDIKLTDAEAAEYDALRVRDEARRDPSAVPDAPFKGSGEWAMLAFKRMVRWAAEHGFDRIAWTTGEQQAERYDLSKQVEIIRVITNADGSRRVRIHVHESAERPVFDVSTDGVVEPDSASSEQFRGKALGEILGKEMAEKIMAVEGRHEFTGVELAIGGDGLRAFYDKILPAAVSKWSKRLGATVGSTAVLTKDREQVAIIEANARSHFGEGSPAYQQAMANHHTAVHSIDLTEAMRETALDGLPLFKRSAPVQDDAEIDDERSAFRF